MFSRISNFFSNSSVNTLMTYAFAIRLAVIIYGVIHDSLFALPYTDVDYLVVTDGSRHMLEGRSPFDRETYRYTPLLAAFFLPSVMVPGFSWWGKVVVAFCDVVAGYFVTGVLTKNNNNSSASSSSSAKFLVSCFIWFNPVVINVSTRGNSDIIITALALASLASFSTSYKSLIISGLYLGFAIHMKIYPIIYAAPFVFCLFEQNNRSIIKTLPQVLTAGVSTLVGAVVPTYLCYLWYGQQFLDEAILYHVGRIDHRHNLSPYFLQMYYGLFDLERTSISSTFTSSLLSFIPQMTMLVVVSWILRRNAAHAITIETMLFVAFNKVCTVQYFVWYLPFLPFIFHNNSNNDKSSNNSKSSSSSTAIIAVVVFWVVSLLMWMLTGKGLEFDGKDNFSLLWICSCIFFVAQVCLAAVMMRRALSMSSSGSSLSLEKKK